MFLFAHFLPQQQHSAINIFYSLRLYSILFKPLPQANVQKSDEHYFLSGFIVSSPSAGAAAAAAALYNPILLAVG
jgi:hypothetical protein